MLLNLSFVPQGGGGARLPTDGNGVIVPIMNEMKLVIEVMVIETAASAYVWPNRSGTGSEGLVRRQAASRTNASSMPTPD